MKLGRVNILTGRNASGKSTILRRILESPDLGITYKKSDKTKAIIRSHIRNFAEPTPNEINEWINNIQSHLDNEIIFMSSERDMHSLVSEARRILGNQYALDHDIAQVSKALVSFKPQDPIAALLSPKRHMQHQTIARTSEPLDPEATIALSRLFYLRNQPLDSNDKNVFENILNHFRNITGMNSTYRFFPIITSTIQLLSDAPVRVLDLGEDEGLGLSEVLSILLY